MWGNQDGPRRSAKRLKRRFNTSRSPIDDAGSFEIESRIITDKKQFRWLSAEFFLNFSEELRGWFSPAKFG
jgi:hypothetical protein